MTVRLRVLLRIPASGDSAFISQKYDAALAAADLTVTHFTLLRALLYSRGARANEISWALWPWIRRRSAHIGVDGP